MTNLFSLEGKNALITGASYGIGFNIAKAFVKAGIKNIIFNDINEEALARGLKNYADNGITNVKGYVCDVTKEDDVKEMIEKIQEVYAAKDILKAAGLRREGVNIISCPTCGRTRIDLISLVNRVDEALKNCEKPITVAVMGCVVNGPGEAREADIGIAGGDGWGMLFEKGVQVEKLPYDQLLPALLARIESL